MALRHTSIYFPTAFIAGVLLLVSCKKDNPKSSIGYYTIELGCDTFNRYAHHYTQKINKLSVHKGDPSLVVYSLQNGKNEDLYCFDLNKNDAALLMSAYKFEEIDINKNGQLVIAAEDLQRQGRQVLLGKCNDRLSFKKIKDGMVLNAN